MNPTNIPAPRVPFVDLKTGLISREWYAFLINLFAITGGGVSATTIPELEAQQWNTQNVVGMPALDGEDGEDGFTIIGPKGDRGPQGLAIPGMDGQDADDWQMPQPVKAPDSYRLQGGTWGAPGAIGDDAANSGNFTTGVFSDTITPHQTKGIVGTTTNNDAQAGSVGEYVSAQLANPGNALTSSTTTNVANISLTAGDWDVTGIVGFLPAASTSVTYALVGIATASATIGAQGTYADANQQASVPGGGFQMLTPTVRLSLSATTTIYLIGYLIFSVSTATIYGNIRARRVR